MRGRKLTRRQILAGAAGAGGTGLLVGTGTGALLADSEIFSNTFVAGALDLEVTWGNGNSSEGPGAISIDSSTGSETLNVGLPDLDGTVNNPAYVWLLLDCPGTEEKSDLACILEVRLSYVCSGNKIRIAPDDGSDWAPLLEVANEIRNTDGIPLDPNCDPNVDPGKQNCLTKNNTIELLLEWQFVDHYDGDATLKDLFRFEAEQCRHNDGSNNPFTPPTRDSCGECPDYKGISYVEIYADVDGNGCDDDDLDAPLGKIELLDDYCGENGISENLIAPGTYNLYKDDDCNDTGYDVEVTNTDTKTEDGETETTAVAFELIDPDGNNPDLCQVEIKGGSKMGNSGGSGGTKTYDQSDFDGNSTDGLLYAPENGGS